MTTSAGRRTSRIRESELRARHRDQRLAPVLARLDAKSTGHRPAHETIVWKPEQPLWTTVEERWEAHVRNLFMVRDQIVAESGRAGWEAHLVRERAERTARLRFQRLGRLPKG